MFNDTFYAEIIRDRQKKVIASNQMVSEKFFLRHYFSKRLDF